jgi:LPS-assembly protein
MRFKAFDSCKQIIPPKKRFLFTVLLSIFNVFTFADQSKESLDWIPIEQLTDKQQESVRVSCCGAYIVPERTDPDALLPSDNAPIKVTAGGTVMKKLTGTEGSGSYIELTDQVDIMQGNRRIQADKAIIDEANDSLELQGNITLREPNLLVTGDTATVDRDDNSVTINDAQYVIHSVNTRGSATKIEKANDNKLILTDSSYTQCVPGDNAWLLKSSEITIDNEKQQGYAKHVRLLVKDVPVLYSPYLTFPLSDKRQSGFLSPSISSSESKGINVAIPFYFDLAPNYDLVLTPSSLEDHGLLLEADARHLNHYFYTEVSAAYLSDDEGGFDKNEQRLIDDGTLTEAEARPFKGESRWLLDIQQHGGILGQNWSSTIDYAAVSDDDYFLDLHKGGLSASDQTHLNQQITADYRFQYWQIGIETKRFESLIDENEQHYRQLPLLQANGYYDWQNWSLQLDHEWVRFDNEAEGRITGDRTRFNHKLLWDNKQQAGFFKPALQFKHLRYALNDENFTDKPPSITVPQATIDAGLFFERNDLWFDRQYQQTFEPRIYYLRSQFKDQTALAPIDFDTADLTFSYDQLFRDTRFSGGDRIDDANQLSVGLTTRFIDPQSNYEWFNLNVGKIFYFDDRRIALTGTPDTNSSSDIASRISSNINDRWRLTSDLLYNQYDHKVKSSNVGLKYRKDKEALFNLDYRDVYNENEEDTIKQLYASLIVPLDSNKWYFIGQNGYDINDNRQLEILAGLEYNDCCYRIRFAWQQLLNRDLVDIVDSDNLGYDRGWFIQVQLHGLGGTGKQLDEIFDQNIDGYADWQGNRR